jgi:phosphate transport system permease protein
MGSPAATVEDFRGEFSGRKFLRRLRAGDQIAWLITAGAAAMVFVITALLVYELYNSSALSRMKFGWSFLSGQIWDPVAGEFGALPFIYGTIMTSALALMMAVPLGVGAAVFLSELAPPRISDGLTFIVELLAAVPSVIYGLLGIFILVPIMRQLGAPYGVGIMTAAVVLAIMILPFIVSISREALMSVPREQREAALALGATRWEATWQVVVPYAKLGIFGSVFLALARALGETMAVTMVIGNNPRIDPSPLAPGYSIAAVIANEFTEATDDLHLSALIELGLVLFAITILLNGLARLLILTTKRRGAEQ